MLLFNDVPENIVKTTATFSSLPAVCVISPVMMFPVIWSRLCRWKYRFCMFIRVNGFLMMLINNPLKSRLLLRADGRFRNGAHFPQCDVIFFVITWLLHWTVGKALCTVRFDKPEVFGRSFSTKSAFFQSSVSISVAELSHYFLMWESNAVFRTFLDCGKIWRWEKLFVQDLIPKVIKFQIRSPVDCKSIPRIANNFRPSEEEVSFFCICRTRSYAGVISGREQNCKKFAVCVPLLSTTVKADTTIWSKRHLVVTSISMKVGTARRGYLSFVVVN